VLYRASLVILGAAKRLLASDEALRCAQDDELSGRIPCDSIFDVSNARDSRFLRACRREPVDRSPVWFMRQAGRSLPEYRAIREKHSVLEISRTPELCAEVTLQPLRRLGVDAAILFADIMHPLIGVGVELDLVEDVGPVVQHPVRDATDLRCLRPIEPEADLPYVLDSVRLLKRELGPVPLIGFAGAPFTLASYLVEGKPSRTFLQTKMLMYRAPDVWHELMHRLTAMTIAYLAAQIDAGVDAVQLFDSWVGCLGPADYATYVRPYTREIMAALGGRGVPRIHFGTDTATLLPQMRDDGADVIGVDWRIPLDLARETIGPTRGVQGNLDPAAVFAPWDTLAEQAKTILRQAGGRPGHVFNLGHGIDPKTPLDNLARLVELVHDFQPGLEG
jgi:uroporphyrinogen decarboxylase